MQMQDDLIKEFLAEAREHLANMETDLLSIEEAGAAIDEELVNKVFRAAHSIKGGSSFFGLNKIKDLAHKAETVLDMIRSRKMEPNPEITNILLVAFDKLRDMINNVAQSENADISEHVASLSNLVTSYLPDQQKDAINQVAVLQSETQPQAVGIPATDLERARRTGQFIYVIEYDLIHDIERKGKSIVQVFNDLYDSGEILDVVVDYEAVGTLDDPVSNRIPLRLTFATILEPDIIGSLVDVDEDKIKLLFGSSAPGEGQAPPEFQVTFEPPAPVVEAAREEPPEIPSLQVEELPVPVAYSIPEPEPALAPALAPAPVPATAVHEAHPEMHDAEAKGKGSVPAGESTLRVDVSLLESLMNLAGELVLSRNQLREAVLQNDHRALVASSQRINLVTSELQDAIMQTRMQPIGNVFGKFPRVVRDIARSLSKEIQLDIRGKDVELDKSLVEGLSDPLTHMVRNAADHGIEAPAERVAQGKKPVGTIRLEARHEAGQVVVEVADDGKGIDPQRIAASALKRGQISREKLQGMSDKDKMALVFLPGLSTAETVTDLSGRGVGMDVVKTNLERLGGKAEIDSEPGKGTLFRIKLPLTLAIIPSLIVTVEGERFAIPQINVVELLRIRAEHAKVRIEVVGDSEVLILRDQLVPILRFNDFLGVMGTYIDPNTGRREICRRSRLADRRSPHHPIVEGAVVGEDAAPDEESRGDRRSAEGRRRRAAGDIEIVVVTTGTMQYGLVVDSFQNTEEIVVKPLGRHMKGLQEYAGATIMGDGKVALILDVTGLATKADLTPLSGSSRAEELSAEAEKERLQDTHSLFLFYNGPDELCATPLDTVLRIERIVSHQIEMVGGRRTMQYRGKSLPLMALSDVAPVQPIDEGRDLAVIVSSVYGREVGLLGAMPVDVVESQADIDQTTHRQNGITGSTIIRDKTVLLADVYELVESLFPEWVNRHERPPETEDDTEVTVLLVEDSDFFRAQVRRFLEEGGYKVLEAPDGQAAWELLGKNVEIVRIVVTDIEMPRLTGLGLTERIRSEPKVASLPVIGLSSLAGDDDIARGKAAGINEYQIKLDRDRLLDAVRNHLSMTA
ncbi:MAG: chemotaxis protein CheW [Syntrophobacter sp.]